MGAQARDRSPVPERPRSQLSLPSVESNGGQDRAKPRATTPRPKPKATEFAFNLEINGWPAQTFIGTPSGLTELALGWTFAQGLIEESSDVQKVTTYPDRVSLMIDRRRERAAASNGRFRKLSLLDATMETTSAPASQPETSAHDYVCPRARLDRIIDQVYPKLRNEETSEQSWYAAVTDGKEVCVITSDLDPINIVDKLIGWSIAKNVDRGGLILCVSSKVTTELATRVCRAGLPILITSSVPSEDAMTLADQHRMTIVGRARHKSPTIYTHPWRISDLQDVNERTPAALKR
jgi:FdhD protein